jgi:hypothetical protein
MCVFVNNPALPTQQHSREFKIQVNRDLFYTYSEEVKQESAAAAAIRNF